MQKRAVTSVWISLALGTLVVACGQSNAASTILPNMQLQKCTASTGTTHPYVVEWTSASRGGLEAIVEEHKQLAVVHVDGCQMDILSACTAPGNLSYVAYRNQKENKIRITNTDQLYANLPVGAASLEGELHSAGELDVDMTLVGEYEANVATVGRGDLQGDCATATHVVRLVSVGEFNFHTGANADVGASGHAFGASAGASSTAGTDSLSRDGLKDACKVAKSTDTDPPDNCGALVGIEVVPLAAVTTAAGASRASASATATATAAGDCNSGDLPGCTTACDQGSMPSCTNLGVIYATGDDGVTVDDPRATRFYEKACNGGEPVACANIAYRYDTGLTLPKDRARAVAMYEKSCSIGDLASCVLAGEHYEAGPVPQYPQAIALYKHACDGGDGGGCNDLGNLYDSGYGVPQDSGKAVSLYKKGCDAGEQGACANYGYFLAIGRGVQPDPDTGKNLLGNACKMGASFACTQLRRLGN